MLPLRLPFLLLTAFLVSACGDGIDYRPSAIGANDEIRIVVDSTLWAGPVGDALRETIGGEILTLPAPEAAFSITPIHLAGQGDVSAAQTYKNVLIVAVTSDTASVTTRFVRGFFSEDVQARLVPDSISTTATRDNLWRQSQRHVVAVAPTEEALIALLRDRNEHLRDRFNEVVRQRQAVDMFERRRQFAIEDTIMRRHGFAVNVQHDFFIARDSSQFVWLRRVLSDSWRSVFVHYADGSHPNRLDSAYVLALRDSLTITHIQGTSGGYVKIDRRRPLQVRPVGLGARFALEIRGTWMLVSPTTGPDGQTRELPSMAGPFVSYIVYDEDTRRLYFIDGMVFAPRYPKRDFLRQTEAIAYTFRTAQDVARARTAPPAP